MAEMTPELWDVWWGEIRDKLRPQARKHMSIDNWRNLGRIMEQKIVQPAVEAERKRCLAVARKRAQSHADAGNKLKRDGVDQTQVDFEFHRANEAKEIVDEIQNPA